MKFDRYLCKSKFSNVTFGGGKSEKPAGNFKSAGVHKVLVVLTPFVIGDCEDTLRTNLVNPIVGNAFVKRLIRNFKVRYLQNGLVHALLWFLKQNMISFTL